MENLNKLCFMCGEAASDGIIINGERICKKCEEKIVNTKVDDIEYETYKNEVKNILFKDK